MLSRGWVGRCVRNICHQMHPGVYVEMGAYDGHKYSNSRFFEEALGWSGLLIEVVLSLCKSPESMCVAGMFDSVRFVKSCWLVGVCGCCGTSMQHMVGQGSVEVEIVRS